MLGSYTTTELRQQIRAQWRAEQIPKFIRDEVQPLHNLVDPNRPLTAIDVGANKGFWSKAFIDFFGKRVQKIYAIDPSPINTFELTVREDNLLFAEADLDLIYPIQAAAGQERSTAFLYTNDDGSPLASLYQRDISGWKLPDLNQKYPVEVITIDHLMEQMQLNFVDVMKIDVEGYEMNVLLGAEKALNAGKIGTVTFEFGIHQIYSRHFFKDFYQFFTSKGYHLYHLKHEEQKGQKSYISQYTYGWENFSKVVIFAASLYQVAD